MLLGVFALVSVSPDVVEVRVEFVEFLHHFRGTYLDNLQFLIPVLTLLLALLFGILLCILLLAFRLCVLFVLQAFGLFLLGGEGQLSLESVVKFFDILGWLAGMHLFVVLDPVSALLFHLLHYVISLVVDDVYLLLVASCLEVFHELHPCLSALLLHRLHPGERITHSLLDGHRAAGHAQEKHLFLAHALDLLPCEYTLESFLYKDGSCVLLLLAGLFLDKTFSDLFVHFMLEALLLVVLLDQQDTVTALTTTLILLDQSDGIGYA